MKVETKEQRHANPEGSHLCHRNVDEDNAALANVKTEIDKQPRQEDAIHEWPEHYLPHVKKIKSLLVIRILIIISTRSSKWIISHHSHRPLDSAALSGASCRE